MDAVSSAVVSSVAQHGVRRLLLVDEKQEWCFLVCSSGLPSYPVAWSSRWGRLCLATSPSWRVLEEFPLPCCLSHRAVRTWKFGLCLRPRIFQSFGVWVLPVEYVVFGTRALLGLTVDTCSTRGFWTNFTYFLCAVNSDPRRSLSILTEWRSVHLSQRGSHFGFAHYFYELSM